MIPPVVTFGVTRSLGETGLFMAILRGAQQRSALRQLSSRGGICLRYSALRESETRIPCLGGIKWLLSLRRHDPDQVQRVLATCKISARQGSPRNGGNVGRWRKVSMHRQPL